MHKSLIETKGEILTALTIFWLRMLEQSGVKHHLVSYGTGIFDYLPGSPRDYPKDFHLRTIIVRKKKPIPYEFVFRNRLEGSLYTGYYKLGIQNPYGIELPTGMERMGAFPHTIFTPTTKSDDGDVPCTADSVRALYGTSVSAGEKIVALATQYLRSRNIEPIDTKLEFDGDMVIDEVLTPDSSRFTLFSDIILGQAPVSLDKQIARDVAERMWKGGVKIPLTFSPAVTQQLTETYLYGFELITDMSLADFQDTHLE